jgi:hypothetical protein
MRKDSVSRSFQRAGLPLPLLVLVLIFTMARRSHILYFMPTFSHRPSKLWEGCSCWQKDSVLANVCIYVCMSVGRCRLDGTLE